MKKQKQVKEVIKQKVYQPLNKLFISSLPQFDNANIDNQVDQLAMNIISSKTNPNVASDLNVLDLLTRKDIVDLVAHFISTNVIEFFKAEDKIEN